jgi:hypothetical protein
MNFSMIKKIYEVAMAMAMFRSSRERSEDQARNTARRSIAAYLSWPFASTIVVEYWK